MRDSGRTRTRAPAQAGCLDVQTIIIIIVTFAALLNSPQNHHYLASAFTSSPSAIMKTKRLSAKQQSSPLLLLPVELRENIYSHLLYSSRQSMLYCSDCEHQWSDPRLPSQILRVCAQLYSESKDWLHQCTSRLDVQHKQCDVYLHRSYWRQERIPESERLHLHRLLAKYGPALDVILIDCRWTRYSIRSGRVPKRFR